MKLTPTTYGVRSAECGVPNAVSRARCGGANERRVSQHATRNPQHAFTLVEILITVSLLSIIILGLFAVFNQVQRAFRSSMNQVDQLESGRALTGMIPAELEQITLCRITNAVTFYAQVIPNSAPLTQFLPGMQATTPRTNLLQDCFFLQRQNQTWIGVGYCVRTADPATGRLNLPESGPGQLGVGSLYRFSTTNINNFLRSDGVPYDPSQLYVAIYNACNNLPIPAGLGVNTNRMCDGVIHFRLRPFATNGFPIYVDDFRQARFRTNTYNLGSAIVRGVSANLGVAYPDNWSALFFYSNAVPASVELQFGILEQHALDRYNSIGAAAARLAYLQREDVTSRVQLFRQRVQIRNVDPSAYQ